MRLLRPLAIALAATLAALGAANAQPAAYRSWRTLETPHFRVHVPRGLEREGRIAGAAAERAYALLARELVPPRGTIDLVVSDDADFSNGFATPFPGNRMVVFAAPPVQNQGLRLNDDWISLVVVHELTHLFHLDRARGVWALAQGVFGRAPALFPNLYGPSWLTEGLAVYAESRHTTGGRLHDAEHGMLARASALEGRFPRIHEMSLGSGRFPGGQRSYAYGSLFLDHLARTRGDSSVRRFIEAQSANVIPYWLDPPAARAFGISFSKAFAGWRDSLQRTAGERRAPLPDWRELTTHGYYASNPRWLDDTTLVYTGTDGRRANAAYTVTTSGVRTRLGRRSAREASVPLADGGLLFAEIDYVARDVVRSDLHVWRNGDVTRLTRGQRLIQPDARADGTIVAARLGPTRTSLVLLDARGRLQRVLRAAESDETWSEPRWSPDGRRIVAAHRSHGGRFTIEVIDPEREPSVVVAESDALLVSPSWSRDGGAVLFTSEESGTPQIVVRSLTGDVPGDVAQLGDSQTGLGSPEISPDGRFIAAVSLRADGYHVGVAPYQSLPRQSVSRKTLVATTMPQDTAIGRFARYSAWRTLAPRYWYPVLEAAPARGTRIGASTSSSDAVGRHAYSAFLTVPSYGRHPTAGLSYRFAGFRVPLLDASISQDFTAERELLSGGTTDFVGTLLRRSQDASLVATWVRPRVRSGATASIGAGVERRDFMTEPGEFLPQLLVATPEYGRRYVFPRVLVAASWQNLQRPILSISPEDGISIAATVRERWRTDSARTTRSASLVGTVNGYKSLDLPGFAHHVLALRIAGGIADRRAGTALEVGGTSGTSLEVLPGYAVGEGRRTFGVRGFNSATLRGTRAAAGSFEYRAPLVLSSRGLGVLPLFLDRSSLTLFTDAGIADCPASPRNRSVCSPRNRLAEPIASAGVELNLAASILSWDNPQQMRLGLAVPVLGRAMVGASAVSPYLAFGFSF